MTTPLLIYGTITDSFSNLIANASIKFTTADGNLTVYSDSIGQYQIDLANIGYTLNETVAYIAYDKYKNEVYSGSTIANGNKILNISLSSRTDYESPISNRSIQLANQGGNIVNNDNPLPVRIIGGGDIDLVNNPSTVWTITRVDLQPDKEEITIGSDVYRRTFTYTNNILTSRSKWIKIS
jgi:hypothetical protein